VISIRCARLPSLIAADHYTEFSTDRVPSDIEESDDAAKAIDGAGQCGRAMYLRRRDINARMA
jgi:hypothetical protein